ncbi:MAG: hypothetical protein QOK16_452 [Solirubrobacteraceae bacterium]|jgi:hypothetical protein|nr:hypothetical protein [Solirubrobacteraceae bacterium]MEA2183267.1 hypothetical protein [Solirubrobacteraceae bacterium]MEA2185441.1 hypothetical protein [Solirubrobacteraceae bacterium]
MKYTCLIVPTVEAVAKPPINAGGNVYFAIHGSDQAG